MKNKNIILISVILILSGAIIYVFISLNSQKVTSSNANSLRELSNDNINSEMDVLSNNNTDSVNTNAEEKNQDIKFENFFKLAYLAKFTGRSNPPVTDNFNINDKMVLSVRVVNNLQTDLKMEVKIYHGSQEISATSNIDILDGEVGLKNPGKSGDYEACLSVNNIVVGNYSFTIE